MVGFTIKTLTQQGVDALQQCINEEREELKKKSLLDRMKFNKIWIRKTSNNPLSDTWIVNPNALRFLKMDSQFSIKSIVTDVHASMMLNGAVKGVDYFVEIDEV